MAPLAEGVEAVRRLAVAGLGGLAVGIEREWSKTKAGSPRFAGVRTFLLLGLLGGLAGEFIVAGAPAAAATLLAGVGLLVAGAYALTAWRGDVDGTTEVSAFLVLAVGVLAGLGWLALASGLSALTALVLVEKSRIHGLVYRLQPETLEAAARFAVLALVVLPLLPVGPYGPAPGFRPRELWFLVLLFSGLSFAGYVGLRVLGPGRGHGVAGLLGGLISSTAVTLGFARESRGQPAIGRALGLGVIAACTVLQIRAGVLATVLNPAVGLAAIRYLAPPLVVGVVAAGLVARRPDRAPSPAALPRNPLRLAAAVQLAVAFQAVLYAMSAVADRFGARGLVSSAALLGLTDIDALTYSVAKLGTAPGDVPAAARALGVGILSNTLLKLTVALVLGRGAFRRVAGAGLAALAVAGLAALLTG